VEPAAANYSTPTRNAGKTPPFPARPPHTWGIESARVPPAPEVAASFAPFSSAQCSSAASPAKNCEEPSTTQSGCKIPPNSGHGRKSYEPVPSLPIILSLGPILLSPFLSLRQEFDSGRLARF
jgi:hypothetical protein